LIIALSDGREVNVGEVVAPDLAERIKVISTMSTNGAVGIKDEGTSISTGVKNINFVGATVTATSSGDDVTVNVSAGTGTVTSVGGTGTVNGLTLTGTVTTSGNLTLGGTLNLLSPPAIGATTPASGAFTTLSATGVTTVQAGTAALPAITTTGDTNTGIFFPAADTIAFTEGGAEAMRIDSSGNVGIGTSSPSNAKLDIASGNINLSDTYILAWGGSSGRPNIEGSKASSYLKFSTGGGNTHMMIDSSGNVGIGTSSPSGKLHVAGTLSATGIASFTDSSDSGQINFVPATATKGAFARFSNTGGNAYVGLDNSTGSNFSGGNYALNVFSPTAINFTAGSTNKMLLDASGNLLVGTTTATGSGKTVINASSTNPALSLRTPASSGTVAVQIFFDGDDTDCGSIDVNTTANTTAYTTSSDYRLKENVAQMTGALETIGQLNPVTWNWKNAPEIAGQGFIAHELQAVVSDCVTGEKDAVDIDGKPVYQGIDTSFLVATLTAAIQEQQALITTLTARITALELA